MPKRIRCNNYEIAMASKEMVVTQFDALSRHLYGGTEQNLSDNIRSTVLKTERPEIRLRHGREFLCISALFLRQSA